MLFQALILADAFLERKKEVKNVCGIQRSFTQENITNSS